MGDCCRPGSSCETAKARSSRETPCPRCGAVGRIVSDETITAILNDGFAAPLLAVERRFCATPA